MIRVKDYSGDLVQLEVQINKYIEGGCLAVVLLEPETEDLYTVLSRNIEEAIPFLKENQTLIPIGDEMDDEIIQVLLEAGVLIRTGVQFPYNFYERRQNTHDFSRGMNAGCWVEGVEKK